MSWIDISFRSRLILIAYLLCVSANRVVSNISISATVTRRLSGDIILYNISETTNHFSCDKDNATILVSDRRCVKNQDLISGKLLLIYSLRY